jgi:hypothetical protein
MNRLLTVVWTMARVGRERGLLSGWDVRQGAMVVATWSSRCCAEAVAMSPTSKIAASHLSRLAIVYVRQSTSAQVRQNTGCRKLLSRVHDALHQFHQPGVAGTTLAGEGVSWRASRSPPAGQPARGARPPLAEPSVPRYARKLRLEAAVVNRPEYPGIATLAARGAWSNRAVVMSLVATYVIDALLPHSPCSRPRLAADSDIGPKEFRSQFVAAHSEDESTA